MRLMNEALDISTEFDNPTSTFFQMEKLNNWDMNSLSGSITWCRKIKKARHAFNQTSMAYEDTKSWSFPPDYPEKPELLFSSFRISHSVFRVRIALREIAESQVEDETGILVDPCLDDPSGWQTDETEERIIFSSPSMIVELVRNPFSLVIRDGNGNLLTSTIHQHMQTSLRNSDEPVCEIVHNQQSWEKRGRVAFTLSHDERLYGTGESFTSLNKRGQTAVLWSQDAHGCQTERYYKPVPFVMSNRGWGLFLNTTMPAVFDMGKTYDRCFGVYAGDPIIDLFLFTGTPETMLTEYTRITGRAACPPLWSFGLWMSRITYKTREEVEAVADKMRTEKIPCDVIHIDTGWFESDWRCDFAFSPTRFPEPEAMIHRLAEDGYHISLWQLPYFTPRNPLYRELVENGYAVAGPGGRPPTDDAILDFTNPEASVWYKNHIRNLISNGVSAIKADFGEAAPLAGWYASGYDGMKEHNRYPLLYNKAVFEATCEASGEGVIWGRSAWAGSQRYPVHWAGDAENTASAMAATLRAGLSLGLSGFTFWSHDIGGFVKPSDKALYRRWLPFGMLTSHSRCHGAPPKEPWFYDREFTDFFRYTVEFKYRLMPYIMAESIAAANKGWPMVRPLFFHYPSDRTSWFVEDEYLFGRNILAAPIFSEDDDARDVYLPPGRWVDIQTDAVYEGGFWHMVSGGRLMMPVFVREGTVVPLVEPACSTSRIDWDSVTLYICSNTEGSGSHYSSYAASYHPDIGLYDIDTVSGRAVGADHIICRKVYSLVKPEMRQ